MNFLAIGALVNSALYLALVAVAAIWTGNKPALLIDIIAVGVTYLSYIIQSLEAPPFAKSAIVGLSVMVGAAAGLVLL